MIQKSRGSLHSREEHPKPHRYTHNPKQWVSIGYLSRYFVLFCSREIHWTRMLQIGFLVSLERSLWWAWFHDLRTLWKALHKEGCMGLIPWPLESLKSSPRGGVHGLDSMTFGVFEKLSTRRGAWAWFHDLWTWGAKVLEYWMISSMKIKLNRTWKFRGNWNVPLVLLERSWWAGLNGI